MTTTHDHVQNYYGKVLQETKDLQTNACETSSNMADNVKAAACLIHEEVLSRYYGCGVVMSDLLEGCRVLDLGCGAGRDCYIISKLVGPEGRVVGVDMTKEQLDVANRHLEFHAKAFGFEKTNVCFKHGFIECLSELDLVDEYFDVVVSNCVINLSPDKEAVLREAYRVLKNGGELYFSDLYSDRRVPRQLVDDEVLYGEGLSGALYWNDFLNIARKVGFSDPRLVEDAPITINNKKIEERVGHIKFWSATYRLFKIPELESCCEDYGEAVIYKGTIPNHPKFFKLDVHHTMDTGRVFPVCRNTRLMLEKSRFAQHFAFVGGEANTHYGIFSGCGTTLPFSSSSGQSMSGKTSSGGSCC